MSNRPSGSPNYTPKPFLPNPTSRSSLSDVCLQPTTHPTDAEEAVSLGPRPLPGMPSSTSMTREAGRAAALASVVGAVVIAAP